MTAVLLYIFNVENLKQCAVLKAMGAISGLLLAIIFVQAGICALIGTGLGLGLCAIVRPIITEQGSPLRIVSFAPLLGGAMVLSSACSLH